MFAGLQRANTNTALCVQAYSDAFLSKPDTLDLPGAGFHDLQLIDYVTAEDEDGRKPYGFLATDGDTLHFPIRGTNDPAEIREDLIADLIPAPEFGPDAMGHEWFLRLYRSLRLGDGTPAMERLAAWKGSKIELGCHSLGSSIGTIVYGALGRARVSSSLYLLALASPRALNSLGCVAVDGVAGTIERIVNDEDGVPDLPPEWMGYRHVNGLIPLKGAPFRPLDPLYNHHIATYQQFLPQTYS